MWRCRRRSSLVLDANVNILLTSWDDVGLLAALERGKLCDGFLDNAQCRLDLLISDDKWWCHADDVLVCGFRLKV